MNPMYRLGLMAACAVAVNGCNESTDAATPASVTVELRPPQPYKPEPGFSLPTDLPARNEQTVETPTDPRR